MSNPNLQLLETDGDEYDFREQNQAPLLLPGISESWRHHSSVLLLLLLLLLHVTEKTRACAPLLCCTFSCKGG